jgi:hypothetical protein
MALGGLQHPETLFALTLAAVWVAVFVLSRRTRAGVATYAVIWQRLADRRRKPRVLAAIRRVLSVAAGLAVLGALVLSAADPVASQPEGGGVKVSATDLILLVDTSPSTVRRHGTDRAFVLRALADRAKEWLAALGPYDRAWLVAMQQGTPAVAGPVTANTVAQAHDFLDRLCPDFTPSTLSAYMPAFAALANGPLRQAPVKESGSLTARSRSLICISDDDRSLLSLPALAGWPTLLRPKQTLAAEFLGREGVDAAFLSVEAVGDGHVRVLARGGERVEARFSSGRDATGQVTNDSSGGLLVDLLLPAPETGIRLTLLPRDDAVPENNVLELAGRPVTPPSLATVVREELDRELLRQRLTLLAPEGILLRGGARGAALNDRIVIAHDTGAYTIGPETRALVCFGALPSGMGTIGEETDGPGPVTGVLRAPAWITGETLELPVAGLGFRKLRLLDDPQQDWTALLTAATGTPLVSCRRVGDLGVLYVASTAYECDVLADAALPLVLRRWFARLARPETANIQQLPLYRTGDVIPVAATGTLSVSVTSPFLTGGTRELLAVPDATTGTAGFGETWYPGVYSFSVAPVGNPPETAQTTTVHWMPDPAELAYGPAPAELLAILVAAPSPVAEPEKPWHERTSVHLALAAVALMLIEWLLFWLRVFD